MLSILYVVRSQYMILSYRGMIYEDLTRVPTAPVALVFGGGVKPDGTPSDALRDRVLASVDLYTARKVRKIVMTGDNGSNHYDEVTPMRTLAIRAGVPSEDVVGDYAGFRTYESCYRAREVFGLWDVVAVSQEFHLPRILYLCNTMGVHAVGFEADRALYRDARLWNVREFLARIKAVFQREITKPLPRYLGDRERVFSS